MMHVDPKQRTVGQSQNGRPLFEVLVLIPCMALNRFLIALNSSYKLRLYGLYVVDYSNPVKPATLHNSENMMIKKFFWMPSGNHNLAMAPSLFGPQFYMKHMEVSMAMGVPPQLDGLFHGKSHLEIRMMKRGAPFQKTSMWTLFCSYFRRHFCEFGRSFSKKLRKTLFARGSLACPRRQSLEI